MKTALYSALIFICALVLRGESTLEKGQSKPLDNVLEQPARDESSTEKILTNSRTRIKIFEGGMRHADIMEKDVNEWLKLNDGKIIVTSVSMTPSPDYRHQSMYVIIRYTPIDP